MQRPVLIVIDMVNDFLAKWAPAPKQELVRSINDLVGRNPHKYRGFGQIRNRC